MRTCSSERCLRHFPEPCAGDAASCRSRIPGRSDSQDAASHSSVHSRPSSAARRRNCADGSAHSVSWLTIVELGMRVGDLVVGRHREGGEPHQVCGTRSGSGGGSGLCQRSIRGATPRSSRYSNGRGSRKPDVRPGSRRRRAGDGGRAGRAGSYRSISHSSASGDVDRLHHPRAVAPRAKTGCDEREATTRSESVIGLPGSVTVRRSAVGTCAQSFACELVRRRTRRRLPNATSQRRAYSGRGWASPARPREAFRARLVARAANGTPSGCRARRGRTRHVSGRAPHRPTSSPSGRRRRRGRRCRSDRVPVQLQ